MTRGISDADDCNGNYVKTELCGHIMREGQVCNMEKNHKGRHSSQGWCCDGCGKIRRGYPAATARDEPYDEVGHLWFCFMCVKAEQDHPQYMMGV